VSQDDKYAELLKNATEQHNYRQMYSAINNKFTRNKERLITSMDNAYKLPDVEQVTHNGKKIAMDDCYFGYQGGVDQRYFNQLTSGQVKYFWGQGFIGYQQCAILSQNDLISRACSKKGKTAVSAGYSLQIENNGTADQEPLINKIELFDNENTTFKKLKAIDYWKEVNGVAHVFFDVGSPNDVDYSQPMDLKNIKPNSYCGFRRIDPKWINPCLEDDALNDPLSKEYGEPTYYDIGGNAVRKIHKSWIVKLITIEVSDDQKLQYKYGGVPLTQKIWKKAYATEKGTDESTELLHSKRMLVKNTDIAKVIADPSGFIEAEEFRAEVMANFAMNLIDRKDSISQLETNLTGVTDIPLLSAQMVASSAGIPFPLFMSDTPKGFNSTGAMELKQYIGECTNIQVELSEVLNKHYKLLAKSMFNNDSMLITHEWNSVDFATDTEKVNNKKTVAETQQIYANIGALPEESVTEYLQNEHNGLNIDTGMLDERTDKQINDLGDNDYE
jgi:hypothetical protein